MSNAPRIGDVQDGFMFIGGNPADQNSWRSQAPTEPEVIQEEHPEISWKDRLVVKNFASSPESSISYLKKEHPDLEFGLSPSGQIKVKGLGEPAFRVLDPEGINSFTEAAKDLGDVGYDIASGIGTTVATAAGGLAGAPTGPGALASAAGAGAAASGGFEALRQGLGSAAGLEDNMDLGQIGGATLTGAASPLLFGTGATAANVAGKGAAAKLAGALGAKNIPSEIAEQALRNQRGIPGIAFDKVIEKTAPKIGGFLSGTPEQTVRDLSAHVDDVAKYEKDPLALKDFIESEGKKNLDLVNKASGDKYKQLATHIEKTVGDGTIDVTKAAQPMFEKIKELKSAFDEMPSGDAKAALDDAIKAYEDVWGKLKVRPAPDGDFTLAAIKIKPTQLKQVTTSIQDVANFGDRFAFGTVKPKTSDVIELMGSNSYAGLKEAVEDAAKGSGALRDDLAKILTDKAEIYKNFNPGKVLQNAENFGSSKTAAKAWAERAKNFDKMYGTNFDKLRGTAAATKAFNKDTPFAFGKRIPSVMLGGLAGYGLSHSGGQGDAFMPGVTAGMAAGALLGGPQALRGLVQMSKKTGGGYIAPSVTKTTLPIWNMMSRKQGQEGR